jgi:hypothetical protein
MVREIGNRPSLTTELVDVAAMPMPVDDAEESIKDSLFADRMARADGLVIAASIVTSGFTQKSRRSRS